MNYLSIYIYIYIFIYTVTHIAFYGKILETKLIFGFHRQT